MSADQIAEIAPLIREVLGAPEGQALCGTIEVDGMGDAWAQVTADAINVAYPSAEDPARRLSSLVGAHPCAGVAEWEPMKFTTFNYTPDRPQVIAKFIDGLLRELFGLGDYSVNIRIFEL